MDASTRPREFTIAAALILSAAAVRIVAIDWGLPSVYEEAVPLARAWEMWHFGDQKGVDLNPHFFNYPSLTLYCQFVAQGLLYLGMKLWGTVDSTLDFRVLYLVTKTPFFVVGRLIGVLFAVATVWLTLRLGQKIQGYTVGLPAAILLAVNTFHISRSQMIEVDVPLTLFVMLALWFAVHVLESPRTRNYVLAGLAMGLAASTKYTGMVLVVPLLVSHVIVLNDKNSAQVTKTTIGRRRRLWVLFGVALLSGGLAFLATSPFVLLDHSTFLQHLSVEREHMRLGHFGLDKTTTWGFYVRSLAGTVAGWPVVLLSLLGFVYLTVVRRRPWAMVLAAFMVPYFVMLNTWSMKADRYLLPLLPVAILFAVGAVAEILRLWVAGPARRAWRAAAVATATLVFSIPAVADYPGHLNSLKRDTRTEARLWVEKHVAAGTFIAMESYGPELLACADLVELEPLVRHKIFERTDAPVYATQWLPMLQVKPERSAVFYDLALYEVADMIITSGAVRSRYLADPVRFERQVAFYDSLAVRFEKIHEIQPLGRSGPTLTFYKNPGHDTPFGRRHAVDGPQLLGSSAGESSQKESLFYYSLALNYEMYRYLEEALASYDIGLRYPRSRISTYNNIIAGKARCLVALGRGQEAIAFVSKMAAGAPTPQARERMLLLRDWVREQTGTFGTH